MKPGLPTSRRYGPIERLVSAYVPSVLLTVERTTPVSVWVALTTAPETAEPDASWMDPWIDAVDWAHKPQLSVRNNAGNEMRFDTSVTVFPSLFPARGCRTPLTRLRLENHDIVGQWNGRFHVEAGARQQLAMFLHGPFLAAC